MTRRAIVKIAGEVLPEAAGLLSDHGIRIVYSLGSMRAQDEGAVFLVIEDQFGRDLLPDLCDAGPALVTVTITLERYGKQQLRKITAIDFVEPVTLEQATIVG
ncbi:hypothetical protein ACVWZL_003301 [Bradyrhizobium sp. GM2.4]